MSMVFIVVWALVVHTYLFPPCEQGQWQMSPLHPLSAPQQHLMMPDAPQSRLVWKKELELQKQIFLGTTILPPPRHVPLGKIFNL